MGSVPGVDGPVRALETWDPDGMGPATPQLVVGGKFAIAGDTVANNIAMWDPSSGLWSALGTGIGGFANAEVMALAVLPGGDLVAAGSFTIAGGVACNGLACWDGVAWTPLGSGVGQGVVRALAVLPNGDLIAGGQFASVGGAACSNLARWDGAAWSPLGAGTNNEVQWLAALPITGTLVASGRFSTAGSLGVPGIANWDGTRWSSMGAGTGAGGALAVTSTGALVANISYLPPSGVWWSGIGTWNSAAGTWTEISAGAGLPPTSVSVLLAATGLGYAVGGDRGVYLWTGSAWSPPGSGIPGSRQVPPVVSALAALSNGDLMAGGEFMLSASNIARWDGTAWRALGTGLGAPVIAAVHACVALPNGDVVAAGDFTNAGGVITNHVARWDGSSWLPLGAGVDNVVYSLVLLGNGDLVVGGGFASAGGVPVTGIARWDGSAWSAIGPGLGPGSTHAVTALAEMPNGDLAVGVSYWTPGSGMQVCEVLLWDGATWSPLGSGMSLFSAVTALAVLPSGDLIAGGNFITAGGVNARKIARWDGTSWSPLGSGFGTGSAQVNSLAVTRGGTLVAAGTWAGGVSYWDGSAWSLLAGGANDRVQALAVLPSGDVLAAGRFSSIGGVSADKIARWREGSWSALGATVGGPMILAPEIFSLAPMPDGDLVAGGAFASAGGLISASIARYQNCGDLGGGCTGSLGVPGAEILQQPVKGAAMHIRFTELPLSAGYLLVGSSYTSSAIGALPIELGWLGMPGCQLRVSLDFIEGQIGAGNTVDWVVAIPDDPSLCGARFGAQFLALDPPANVTGATLSDALLLRIDA